MTMTTNIITRLPADFHPHESPWTMTVPLIVLAVLSTVGGLVGVPYALSGGAIPNVFEETLEPVIAKVSHTETKHAPTGLGEHGATDKATENHSTTQTRHSRNTRPKRHTPNIRRKNCRRKECSPDFRLF